MKKRYKLSAVLAAALVIVLIAATAYAATQYFGGYVDWNGTFTPSDETNTVLPTIAPDADDSMAVQKAHSRDLVLDVPDGEYWRISREDGGTGAYGDVGKTIDSLAALHAELETCPLPVPTLPDGYIATDFELRYELENLVITPPYETTETEYGTFEKYHLAQPTPEDIHGYSLTMKDANNTDRIFMDLYLYPTGTMEPNDEIFYVEDASGYTLLHSDFFDRGIVIASDSESETAEHQNISLEKMLEDGSTLHVYIYAPDTIPAQSLTALFAVD